MRHLRPGSQVAIVSLSWGGPAAFPEIYQLGLRNLEKMALIPIEFPTARMANTELHKNPKLRAKDLMDAFADSQIDAVISTIGGSDSVRILPFLDKKLLRDNAKICLGYSDSTAYLTFLNACGMVTFYGPSVMSGFAQWENYPEPVKQHFFDILFAGKTPMWSANTHYADGYPDWKNVATCGQLLPLQPSDGWHWLTQPKEKCEGILWGGCAEVLEMLKGTPFWQVDWRNRILFLETSEDKPSPTWVQYWLRNYGMQDVFSQIRGLVIGRPQAYTAEEKKELDERILATVVGEFGAADIPIITNFDFGHTDPKWLIPLGGKISIDSTSQTIELLEPVCSQDSAE